MNLQVFFLVCKLIEAHITSLYRAGKWLFPSVDSDMVEKVVNFFEIFITVFMVTCEYCRWPSQRTNVFLELKPGKV